MQPRSFQAKLLVLMIAGLVLLQIVTLAAVHVAGLRTLQTMVADELEVGARVLNEVLSTRGKQLGDSVRVLAADFAFREAIASQHRPTIIDVLTNHGARIDADAAFLVSLDNVVEADTLDGMYVGRAFPIAMLVDREGLDEGATTVVSFDGRPYQFVAVPVLAPQPIATVSIGFAIDETLLDEVRRLTGMDVMLRTESGQGGPAISTLEASRQARILSLGNSEPSQRAELTSVELDGMVWETLSTSLETADGSDIRMVLLRNVQEARKPLRRLELQIFALTTLALVGAVIAATFLARGVSRPLLRLAEAARRIEHGDYSSPDVENRDDEIGQLSRAFDQMGEGIREREEKIRFQATHDPLTGLPNRTLFIDRLDNAIGRARRLGGMVGMVIMDVDRFKEINDTLGHPFGDDLLIEIGRRLAKTIRESDTVARLGGDEFSVMFETNDSSHALEVARRVQSALESSFMLGGVSIDVGASMGISLFPEHADDAETLMKRADIAMYDAKRNQLSVSVYEPGRDEHSLRRLAILSELRQAIGSDELELHYQPKVELASGRAIHAEALVRWRHPVHGMMPPDEFIPLAEQSGNVRILTKWVLRRAIRDCAAWNREGHDITIAVNLSALDLYDSELPTFISGLIHECGLSESKLVLEITESAVMRDAPRAAEVLADLRGRGIGLAIDDYGTGYSSLAHLKRLPVHELKIDKSFVMHLRDSRNEDGVIVRSTIELGHNMGLKVIAEGVEDEAGLAVLRELGCDMAQGYYFSKPLRSDDFAAWLSESVWGDGTPGA